MRGFDPCGRALAARKTPVEYQAYGDAGFTGNPWIETPFLDSLAAQGTFFTNFYVNPRCAASRAALMTGRYPERSGVFHVTAGAHIMAREEVTMAEVFRDAGYATAIVGKWHIGDHYPYWPNDQGFEHSLIHGGGAVGQLSDHPDNYWDMTAPLDERSRCYFGPTLYRNREPVRTEGYITDVFTDEAIHFVEEIHAEQPFFLYFATNAPHDPFQAPREYLDRYADLSAEVAPNRKSDNPRKLSDHEQAQYVYAMMTNLDDNLRRLAERLQELGEWENTVVVFLSDNGPAGFRFNAGLRDKKGTVYEGGIRSPAFVFQPGKRGAGAVHTPAAHIDVLPTLAGLAGIEPPRVFPLDGRDLGPLLQAGNAADWTERALFSRESTWMAPYHDMMVRRGDWKLVSRLENNEPVFELFDLAADPGEERNLATAHPEKVENLRAEMDRWYRDVRSSPNCRIHPVTIGSPVENPVRLTRHEQVDSYSRGWFSTAYLGYFPLEVARAGTYSMKLTFQEPLPAPGRLEFILGPAGRRIEITDTQNVEVTIKDSFLAEGPATLQAWFQNPNSVVSPFFVEVKRIP